MTDDRDAAATPSGSDDRLGETPPIFRAPPPAVVPRTPHPEPVVEAPSPDVAPAGEDLVLPGAHRGGFARLPTAPVGIAAPVVPVDDVAPRVEWAPRAPVSRGLSAWALAFAVPGLAFSLIVGWGFPIGLVAVVVGVIALRRPAESRGTALWAICLGALSVLYSAGWLIWAAQRLAVLG
nr:hypothetical protein [Microbacterium lemovicicum]